MKAKSSAAPTKNAARNQATSPQAQHLAKAHAAVKSLVESPGRPLDPKTQDAMQSRFGYDFSSVRVHADDKASESARMLGAHAYTTGRHIAFGDGKYAPHTDGGRNLVAHELTHIVQQAHGPVEGTPHGNLSISNPNDSHERAAHKAATSDPHAHRQANTLRTLPASPNSQVLPVQRGSWPPALEALRHPGGFEALSGYADQVSKLASAPKDIKEFKELLHPPDSAASAAGVKIQPQPCSFTFNDYPQFADVPRTPDFFHLLTDDKNIARFNLNMVMHQVSPKNGTPASNVLVVGISHRVSGYRGGGDGSSAEINFNATLQPDNSIKVSFYGSFAAKGSDEQQFDGSATLNSIGNIIAKSPDKTYGKAEAKFYGLTIDYRKEKPPPGFLGRVKEKVWGP